MFDKKIFAERFKELRQSSNITQVEFATQFGVSKSNVSGWETGERLPTVETLYYLALHFNVSTDYLLGLTNKQR